MGELIPKYPHKTYYKNDTDIHDLELKMNNHKVDQVKKIHGAILGLGQYEPNSANESPHKGANAQPASLSIFT